MKPERCPQCRRRYVRSSEANRRYWAILHVMAERIQPQGKTFSPDSWHLWAKSKFLGADDVRLPSGKVLTIPRSSADLDSGEFSDFMTKVEAWANEHGAFLEDEAFS